MNRPSDELLPGARLAGDQQLELILAIGVKTLSNYANHLLHTPLDAVFASRGWKRSA